MVYLMEYVNKDIVLPAHIIKLAAVLLITFLLATTQSNEISLQYMYEGRDEQCHIIIGYIIVLFESRSVIINWIFGILSLFLACWEIKYII